MTDRVQRDPKLPATAYCNAAELDHRCPVCGAEPGYPCLYTMPRLRGKPSPTFHRARTAQTYVPRVP